MNAEPLMTEVDGMPGFWDRVRTAGERCLVLDYDGTLAPFTEKRMEARPLDGIVDALTEIRDAGTTFLAIMTGRPISELLELLGDLGIPVSGSQGTEFRRPDGTTQRHEPSGAVDRRLVRAQSEAEAIAPANRVERKLASVALHTRGLPEERVGRLQEAVCAAWSLDADDRDLECRRFSGGVELRVKGTDKGTALRALLDGRREDALRVYVGDDETDEDAFEVLLDGGIGIKVGPRGVPTKAHGRLESPEAVRAFLMAWIGVTTR